MKGNGESTVKASAVAPGVGMAQKQALARLQQTAIRTMEQRPLLVFGLASLLMLGGLVAGFQLRGAQLDVQQAMRNVGQEVLHQQVELDQLKREHASQIDALAARLAELQASSTRLNALGERLVETGQLDASEFDFSSAPAVGGPLEGMSLASSGRDLDLAISQLDYRLDRQRTQLGALESLLLDRELERAAMPAGWPVDQGWISSGYGRRNDPFTGKLAHHGGIDFSGTRGTAVNSVAAGVVVWAGPRKGYGKLVEIDHGNGFVTRYAHNDALVVGVGDRVAAGQAIGQMGDTGRATAPHVHFEVWKDGRSINPWQYIKALRS